MRAFKDHFSTHASSYAAYRPSYPPELVDYLADLSPARGLALDCGCGTGQLSALLANRFARVIAIDASAQQIANAVARERVEYAARPAERSGLEVASADLISVAQAVHWFDLDAFYAEVRRVAKPNAALALITYGTLHVGRPEAEAILQHFYSTTAGPYWPPERRHVEEGYRSLWFPFPEFQAPSFPIEVSWSLEELLGYVDTWSAVRGAEKALGRAPIEAFRDDMAWAWGDPHRRESICWPLSLRVGAVR
ncbi:MAG TPA: class I SAM-dependent methyltransferase [Steroidobacter sp.]|jgi:SAM-dependent methyltransferase|nr:class I SAM-dependent methyltransferase [Steroidobacter sp.]